MSTQRKSATQAQRDPDMVGAEAAMHRAARSAHQRAAQAAEAGSRLDDGPYSFSQAQGYEEIPAPLTLEELPREARTQIWNLFFSHIDRFKTEDPVWPDPPSIGGPWRKILKAKHRDFDHAPLDEWDPEFQRICRNLRRYIEEQPFNKILDLVQFVLRHPQCPPEFMREMKRTFEACRLAYTIDTKRPPTILPAATPDEGNAIVQSLDVLGAAGLNGSASHLRNASACINRGDWAGSVRESVHAVESVARQLDPEAAKTLAPALKSFQRHGRLHPAVTDAFSKLYGYTSDQQGIRHALLDQTDAQVGQDEAVFMLGACASFASYLWRKHAGGASR